MNSKPLISIIVPVYKADAFLHKCVDSILVQSYQNLEVILVNDGSPDACPEICEEYRNKDSRIKVLHKENGGQSSARNAGLEIATGELLGFVDSDDWIKPEMFEKLYQNMLAEDADLSCCGLEIICNGSDTWFLPKERSAYAVLSRQEALGELLDNHLITFSPVNKLYKRSLVGDLRFVEGMIYEDGEYIERCVNVCETTVCSGEPLYCYNTSSDSTTRGRISRKQLVDIVPANHIRLDFYKKFSPENYNKALNVYVMDLLNVLTSSVNCSEYSSERKLLRAELLELLSHDIVLPYAEENKNDIRALKMGLSLFDLKKKVRG